MGCTSSKKSKIYIGLTTEQIALLKEKTKFTEKEIREWHSGFLKDCPNGKLHKSQLISVYKQFYPQGNVKPFCKYVFAAVDINNDGKIDFVEYLLQIAALTQRDLNKRLAAAFDIYDISRDGEIDHKELSTLISALYDLVGEHDRKGNRAPKKRATDIIAKLDMSGDKKLNKQEFIAGCQNDSVLRRILAPTV
ncbi:unnamed protein product [Adineta steineri]|uniref:EF-hand domain-containing protein n=2 Tax=Adineta steineri TaxID=433720 RepID=A0A815XEK7_9BILA|nr:unnamed protein product [Adineta steineri]CAF1663204.1 unnamed protein product [Adineta steineri]